MLNSTLPRSGTRPKWERADAQRRRARVGTMLNSTLPRSRVPVSERFSSLYLRMPRHGGRHLACTMQRAKDTWHATCCVPTVAWRALCSVELGGASRTGRTRPRANALATHSIAHARMHLLLSPAYVCTRS
jgi:hypothetical protein